VKSTNLGAAGASVAIAALLLGLSVAAASWAVESALLSRAHSNRLDDVRNTLRDAHDLIGVREQAASRRATRLAARKEVQAAFVQRDATALRAIAGARPDVGFILWNGRTIGRSAIDLPHAAITVYSRGRLAGQVVVAVPPDVPLLEAARKGAPATGVFATVAGRVAAASPLLKGRSVEDVLRHDLNGSEILSKNAHAATILYAYRARWGIPLRWLWPFLIGLVVAFGAFRVLGKREVRRRTAPLPTTVRDAVALVGETLAATHNPDALLPVILQASVEATGAAGGTITAEGVQLAARGSTSEVAGRLEVPLEVSEGRPASMTLYPTADGFGPEAEDAAAWIAAQALIALENARLHGQVQRQAVTDELTGLANRRSFLARLDAEVVRSRRSGSPLGVVLADLDDFKRVNDTYGHAAGDTALRSFAAIVHSSSRDVDLPVRLGGEEFAVLLPDTDLDGAAQLAERIREALEGASIEYEGASIALTASFGVSCFPATANAEDLLTDADRRLYQAKRQGKNTVVSSNGPGPPVPLA
jgi:diguanylate cyclase (GGDEF)-like protein